MKALVINMESAEARREFQSQQLNALGISFEMVEAVLTSDISKEQWLTHIYDWQRPLRHQELACLLSHIKCWKEVVQRQEPCLILEDDAYLSKQVPSILNELEQSKEALDHVTLETRKRKKLLFKRSSLQWDGFQLVRLVKDKTGAAAYVLYPSGARKLLEHFERHGAGLADALIADLGRLRSYQVQPAVAVQLDCCEYYGMKPPLKTQTSLSGSANPKPKPHHLGAWLKVKSNRIGAQFKALAQMLPYVMKANWRQLTINKKDFL